MKIEDPTAKYWSVVDGLSADQTDDALERFRLGAHGLTHEGLEPLNHRERFAVIGASKFALRTEQLATTIESIGAAGAMLADLGFQVCAISADDALESHPSLVVWVCGNETTSDEVELLAEIPAPGISIGTCVEELEDWESIETSVRDTHWFAQQFSTLVDAVLTEPELGLESEVPQTSAPANT